MQDIYQEMILEYARNPKNKGAIVDFNIEGVGKNPSCGDTGKFVCIYDKDNKVLQKVNFVGDGCAVSQAGMSMLAERIENKNIEYLDSILPKDIYEMYGVNISPSRALCAMLCYNALQDLINSIKNL